jgi:hypothetical protein
LALIQNPASLVWSVLLLLFAALCLWQAWKMHGAGARTILLREDGLTLDTGELVAPLSEIERIDRSLFAFRPSGGFVLFLKSKAPKAGVTGLFWRRGKRLMVGGTTSSVGARGMADMIQALLIQRDGDL